MAAPLPGAQEVSGAVVAAGGVVVSKSPSRSPAVLPVGSAGGGGCYRSQER